MDAIDDTRAKQWVDAWKQASIELKRIKRQELQAYDWDKQLPVLDELLQWVCDHAEVRLESGLVEQQRWFMKMHRQLQNKQ